MPKKISTLKIFAKYFMILAIVALVYFAMGIPSNWLPIDSIVIILLVFCYPIFATLIITSLIKRYGVSIPFKRPKIIGISSIKLGKPKIRSVKSTRSDKPRIITIRSSRKKET